MMADFCDHVIKNCLETLRKQIVMLLLEHDQKNNTFYSCKIIYSDSDEKKKTELVRMLVTNLKHTLFRLTGNFKGLLVAVFVLD